MNRQGYERPGGLTEVHDDDRRHPVRREPLKADARAELERLVADYESKRKAEDER